MKPARSDRWVLSREFARMTASVMLLAATGCAGNPPKEAQEDLRSITSCGAPRLDKSLAYAVLPVDAEILRDSLERGKPIDSTLSAEAAAVLAHATHSLLIERWGLRTSSVAGSAIRTDDGLRPSQWFTLRSTPPCGERLKSDYAATGNDDILIFLRARDIEMPVGVKVLLGIAVVGAALSGSFNFSSSGPYVDVTAEKLYSHHLLVGMADALTREILWVNTVLLDRSGSLRSRSDAKQLLAKAFDVNDDH